MDLFKFDPTFDPSFLEKGSFINGWRSASWTERYLDSGEFEIKAPLSSGLRDFLPLDTLISHINTYEVMIVENHQITEDRENDPEITITGRSFDSWLENRIVGVPLARASSTISEYILPSDYTWNQVVKLINDHIQPTGYPLDVLDNVVALTYVTGSGEQVARTISRDDVRKQINELLRIDDLGIRTIRRNPFGVVGSPDGTIFEIYAGEDKTNTVIFSWQGGDLETAEYLFSNKKYKTSALVLGRYVWHMVDLSPTNYNRRIMIVPADDLDGNLSAAPTGGALTTLIGKMDVRGQQMLRSQFSVALSRTDISKNTNFHYRRDYNLGDFVTLDGNYGEMAVMRVVEYVEIEDETGQSGHPTLAIPGVS